MHHSKQRRSTYVQLALYMFWSTSDKFRFCSVCTPAKRKIFTYGMIDFFFGCKERQ
jgi:hypothetical protein